MVSIFNYNTCLPSNKFKPDTSNIYFRSSVHHKTAPSGGTHGFPDPNYFTNCHGELDGLNVPPARDLDDDGKKTSG